MSLGKGLQVGDDFWFAGQRESTQHSHLLCAVFVQHKHCRTSRGHSKHFARLIESGIARHPLVRCSLAGAHRVQFEWHAGQRFNAKFVRKPIDINQIDQLAKSSAGITTAIQMSDKNGGNLSGPSIVKLQTRDNFRARGQSK